MPEQKRPDGGFRRDCERSREHLAEDGARGVLGLLRSPGLQAAAVYRFGAWALRQPTWARVALDPLYVILNLVVQACWGIEISRRAQIGPGLYIGHFGGITVSSLAVIGADCAISQQVTIGVGGQGGGCGAPVVGDHVYIGPGAKL